MFGLKSIFVILAAATAFTSALPAAEANGASLDKRVAAPMEADVFARAPELSLLEARAGPATIPACITKAHGTIDPILVSIQAAIDAKASVSVFANLYAEIVVAIQVLTVDILALLGVGVSIFAGLTLSAIATLYVDLFLAIAVKLQATVVVIGVVKVGAFLSVYLKLCAAIVASVQAIVKVCVGINVFLDVQLVAVVNILVQLCLQLDVSLTVIASLKALLLL
jgi:hypothetical protein